MSIGASFRVQKKTLTLVLRFLVQGLIQGNFFNNTYDSLYLDQGKATETRCAGGKNGN
jgi:hypothetical protein